MDQSFGFSTGIIRFVDHVGYFRSKMEFDVLGIFIGKIDLTGFA
jgi:hypothetical protein